MSVAISQMSDFLTGQLTSWSGLGTGVAVNDVLSLYGAQPNAGVGDVLGRTYERQDVAKINDLAAVRIWSHDDRVLCLELANPDWGQQDVEALLAALGAPQSERPDINCDAGVGRMVMMYLYPDRGLGLWVGKAYEPESSLASTLVKVRGFTTCTLAECNETFGGPTESIRFFLDS